jgi:glycine C-acetyltransferase
MDPIDDISRKLGEIRSDGLFRTLRTVSTPQEAEFVLEGKSVVNFSGNNSLGLANHPALLAAARDAIDRFGVGSGASRSISGSMEPHAELEKALAGFMDSERALYFTSGYQANTGSIPVLAGSDALILSDELNHASLIDGIRLSRAERAVYAHNDVDALRRLLEDAPAGRPVVVVTESLFSMEGDRADLAAIAALKSVRPFLLYVDEAHAIGNVGPSGRGLAAEQGCASDVDVLLGTLGKAFGVSGAFIAARAPVIELLVNRARSFIYTTAPLPAAAAAASAALGLVREGNELRERLRGNSARFRELAGEALGERPPGRDHIVPVLCPGAERVMRACAALLERGIFCQGIRPPTVPKGRCRLRFSVSILHEERHLEQAAAALGEVLREL